MANFHTFTFLHKIKDAIHKSLILIGFHKKTIDKQQDYNINLFADKQINNILKGAPPLTPHNLNRF